MNKESLQKFQYLELEVLKDRAQRLSKPLAKESDKKQEIPILLFQSMGYSFALPLHTVEAVTRIVDIFPIPHTPAHIPGVIRRRGKTTALVNLRHFFYPGQEGLIDEDYAVIVKAKDKIFAFQVEDIEGVVLLSSESIIAVPDSYDKKISSYIKGITLDGLALINLDSIVTTEGFGTTRIEE